MANIRNSISMTDRMTPTLRSILKAMDSTLSVMKNLDRTSNKGVQSKAFKQAEKEIKRANNALIKMKNYTDKAGSSAIKATSQYGTLSATLASVNGGMKSLGGSSSMFLQSLASGVYLAQKIANTIGGIMNTSDASRSQVARLGLYNTSNYTNEELYGQVFRTSMDTRSGLTNTADLANKLLISGVYSGENSTQAAIGTAGIINKAMVAGGGTEEENERALRQLTQGLASGVLQGDELRSIREQTPYFAEVLAKGLGEVDKRFEGIGIGDLKALGAQGELTSDVVVKALWAMQDEINADFSEMPKTFGQATTALSNLWQYFLWMLSGTDAPLGKINAKLWQFVDYLQSAKGEELFQSVAVGIDAVATALSWALDSAGQFVVFLQDNIPIVQALFIALGAAAVTSGVSAAISWISACWPILLLIAVVGVLSWAFLNAGYTMSEVVGAIVGGVLWVVVVVWDAIAIIIGAVLFIAGIVIMILTAIIGAVILICQGIVQIVLWVINAIWTAILAIWTAIKTVFLSIWGGMQWLGSQIVDKFHEVVTNALDILEPLANIIDEMFGSNLSGSISSFRTKMDETYTTVKGYLDYGKTFEDIGDMWAQFGEDTADRWSVDSEWNITDNMEDVMDTTVGFMESTGDVTLDESGAMFGLVGNPNDAFDSGYQWGSGVVDGLEGIELGIPDNSVLDQFNPNDITINGGDLDSVGSIDSDVEIGEEDLKLLRDMAARDYLLQLQTITPVANVTFGDVRETADVGQIVEVIEQMVDEQMATALVS